MLKKVTPPPAMVALARRLYVEDVAVAAIMAQTGIKSTKVLYRCLDGHHDDGSGAALPLRALPRRCNGLATVRSASKRGALVARIFHNAQEQVQKIEARVVQSDLAPFVTERDVRSLAVLVRTLRELSELAEMRRPTGKPNTQEPENDPPPIRDLDELRRELARRMQALIDARTRDGISGGPGQ
jgi:hypothetical protein